MNYADADLRRGPGFGPGARARESLRRSLRIEAEGKTRVQAFLKAHALDGNFVLFERPTWAESEEFQLFGDGAFNAHNEVLWTVEIKIEQRSYPNLFLETWSHKARHTPGWFITSKAHLLAHHFLDTDELHMVNLDKLQTWAWEIPGPSYAYRVDAYPEKCPGNDEQGNDGWGRCVPIAVLTAEVGLRTFVMPPKVPRAAPAPAPSAPQAPWWERP
jgi:hypothetical protein